MSEKQPVSEWLKLAGSQVSAAETAIYNYFHARAYTLASKLISKQFQARVSTSDLVNAAMKSAIAKVRQGAVRSNRDDFSGLLLRIVRTKAAEASRNASAQKRDCHREIPGDSVEPAHVAMSPEIQVSCDELMMRSIEFLLRESDDIKRLVNILGIIQGYSAPQIQTFLSEQIEPDSTGSGSQPRRRRMAARTIQIHLSKTRKKMAEEFGVDFDDDE